jgi:hypothetical protein
VEKKTSFDKEYNYAADFDIIYGAYVEGHKFKNLHLTICKFLMGGISNTQRNKVVKEKRLIVFNKGKFTRLTRNKMKIYFLYKKISGKAKTLFKYIMPNKLVNVVTKYI